MIAENAGWAEVDAVFAGFAAEQHIPGLVYAVVQHGDLVRVAGLGTPDPGDSSRSVSATTSFRIASMTKAFTALTVLQLRDEGLITLGTEVAALIPEVAPHPAPTADSRAMTVRDLICHLAGDVNDDPWGDRQLGLAPEAFTEFLVAGWPRARPAGVAFEYSNLGYALLGRVIAAVSGEPYQRVVRDRLLDPLGMAETTFDVTQARDLAIGHRWQEGRWTAEVPEPDGEFGAMGGLVTTAADYSRWVAFLLSAWPPRDDSETGPVRRSTVRELGTGHGPPFTIRVPGSPPDRIAGVYGYGMQVIEDPVLGRGIRHSGGLPGYGSHVWLLPDADTGVFCFANRTYVPAGGAVRSALVRMHGAGLLPPRPVDVPAAVRRAAEAAATAYDEGSVAGLEPIAAVNLLPDVPAHLREAELRELRARFGPRTGLTVHGEHALACTFTMTCENGTIEGDLLLAPTTPPTLQTLGFTPGA